MVGMQRRLHHVEVWLMWERRSRIRVHAAAVVVGIGAAVAGTAAVGKVVLGRPVGLLCLRLSFRAGLRLRLCLNLCLGLIGPDLGLLLLPAELLHERVTVAGTTVRTKWGHRRLRVQRGSLRLCLGARWTLCLGRPGMLLIVVKMV